MVANHHGPNISYTYLFDFSMSEYPFPHHCSVTITNSRFQDLNLADDEQPGGVVRASSCSLVLVDVGIYASYFGNNTLLWSEDSTVRATRLVINNCSSVSKVEGTASGMKFVDSVVLIVDVHAYNNSCVLEQCQGTLFNVVNSTFICRNVDCIGNRGYYGVCFHIENSVCTANISDTQMCGNQALKYAGGMSIQLGEQARAYLNNLSFLNNTSQDVAGGLLINLEN
jgi:hypothetical protein